MCVLFYSLTRKKQDGKQARLAQTTKRVWIVQRKPTFGTSLVDGSKRVYIRFLRAPGARIRNKEVPGTKFGSLY